MAEQDPLVIPIQFTTSPSNLQAVEEDVRRRVGNVPLGAGAGTRGQRTTPPPPTVPAGGIGGIQAQSIQQNIQAAWQRGDTATAQALAGWAQAQGIGVHMFEPAASPFRAMAGGFTYGGMYSSPIGPLPMPGTGPMRPERGGFGPLAGQMYASPIGPGRPGDIDAAERARQQRERILEHSEEFARQGRARVDMGMAMRERAFSHAEEFARQDRVVAEERERRGETIRERAVGHAEEFARRDRARADRGAGIRERAFEAAEEFERRDRVREGRGMALRGRAEEHAEEFARQDRVRATQLRNAEAAWEEGLSDMGPNAQRRALLNRAGAEADPRRRAQIMRRANSLRGRTGLNTEIMSTGMLMSLMFSGWEAMGALNAVGEADRFASLNPQDLRGQLGAQNQAIAQLTGGPLGSWMGMASRGFQGRTAQIESRAVAGEAKAAAMAEWRLSSKARAQDAFVAMGARLNDPLNIEQRRREIQVGRERATQGITDEMDKLRGLSQAEVNAEVKAIHQREIDVNTAFRNDWFADVSREDVKKAAERRAAELQSLNMQTGPAVERRRRELQQEIAKAGVPFDVQQRLLEQERRRFTSTEAIGGMSSMLQAQGREFESRQLAIESAVATGQMSSARAQVERAALQMGATRMAAIDVAAMNSGVTASRLARTGSPLAAALTAASGRFDSAFMQLDSGAPGYQDRVRALESQRREEEAAARQTEDRRRIMLYAASDATHLGLSRRPLSAQFTMIEGEGTAALSGITDQEERTRIHRLMDDRRQEAFQQRVDQIQNVNINQSGRAAQIAALLDRDPTSANVAGIVSSARAEEARMRQAGLGPQADRARQLGIQSLRLERQSYLDSFSNVEVSRNDLWAIPQKTAEDPATVLQNIDKGIRELGTAGAVSEGNVPGLLGQLIDRVDKFAQDFAAKLQN